MGCGCKNKSQQQAPQSEPNAKILEAAKKQQSETIKQTIKKTVEKYYNVQKNTNGYIPE